MTPEENIITLYESVKNKYKDLAVIRQQERDKRDEIRGTEQELCDALSLKYSNYIGKKVKIVGKVLGFNKEPSTITGFFHGFTADTGYERACIKPIIHRIKKNDTESLNKFPLYDVPEEGNFESFELAE